MRRLVRQGTSEKWARRTVLANNHPLECECEMCLWVADADSRMDFDGWSARTVRAGIEAVASVTNEDPEELLEVTTDSATRDVTRKEQAAEQVERDLERMGRERLLPEEKTLEKAGRYEAHLFSRLMFKALHEFEALQVRRSGGTAPLARLDVDGLAAD